LDFVNRKDVFNTPEFDNYCVFPHHVNPTATIPADCFELNMLFFGRKLQKPAVSAVCVGVELKAVVAETPPLARCHS
jgi:hypothetical protein